MKKNNKKTFDAVKFMRQERDRISSEIADLNREELKKYFAMRRTTKRVISRSEMVSAEK